MILDLRGTAWPPVHLGERVLNREHPVDRGLEAPGDIAAYHFGEAPIVAEDRIGCALARDLDDVAKLDIGALPHGSTRRERSREQPFVESHRALRELHADVDRLQALAALGKADLYAADERADRIIDRLLLDAVELERLLVDREA